LIPDNASPKQRLRSTSGQKAHARPGPPGLQGPACRPRRFRRRQMR
jgi:hypothetical protein